MQLNQDWRAFQTVFMPLDQSGAGKNQSLSTSKPEEILFLIADEGMVISQFSNVEDLPDYVGKRVDDVQSPPSAVRTQIFERRTVDQWLSNARDMPHFYDQHRMIKQSVIQGLDGQVLPRSLMKSLQEDHFLLLSLRSWWQRFLPLSYGIFIRLDGSQRRDFLLVYRLGAFEIFHEPDLTGLKERTQNSADVVRYLTEKHMVPVQGIFANSADWYRWSVMRDPWRLLSRALWSGQLKLHPRPMSLMGVVALKGWLGI